MSKFSDFVLNQKECDMLPSLKQTQSTTSIAVASSLQNITNASSSLFSASGANELATQIGNAVYTKDFLEEFSDVIGAPHEDETEDQFVCRCKAEMTALLKIKFG